MLNHRLIAKRRSELGLSHNDVAERTGLQYEHVEEYERIPGIDIDLRSAIVLADALGVSLDRLASSHTDTVHGRADAAAVGALLSSIGRAVSFDSLTIALEWPAARLHAALVELDDCLQVTGQHLQTFDGHRYTIVTDEAATDDAAVRHAREEDLRSLSTTEARLLYAAVTGPRRGTWLRESTPGEDRAVAELRGLGLIAVGTGSTIAATTDVLVDLGLKTPSTSDTYVAD